MESNKPFHANKYQLCGHLIGSSIILRNFQQTNGTTHLPYRTKNQSECAEPPRQQSLRCIIGFANSYTNYILL